MSELKKIENHNITFEEEDESGNKVEEKTQIFYEIEDNPIENLKDSANEKFESKTILTYFQNEVNPYFNKENLKSYLITINFDPSTSYKQAWFIVQRLRNEILTMIYIIFKEDVALLSSTIEHTHEIPVKHKKSPLHNVTSIKELKELYSEYKKRKPQLLNIDESMYTINLLNIYTEMLYTSAIYKREESLKEFLMEKIKVLTPLVDEGMNYKFKKETDEKGENHYKMTKDLYLAHMQEELRPTTVGYPHIHIGMWIESSFEVEKLKRKIYGIVKSYSGMPDIDVSPSKRQGDPLKALGYICKNHSSKIVYESLNREESEGTIVKSVITSERHYEKIREFLSHISNREGENKLTSNRKSKYNKTVAMKIMVTDNIYYKKINPILEIETEKKVMDPKVRLVDAEKTKTNGYINYLQKHMLKHGLVICDDLIYKKIKGSRSSYNYGCKIEDFLDEMEKKEKFFGVSGMVRQRIIKNMKTKQIKLYDDESDDEEMSIEFPKIKIEYRMIEFRDFYYNMITRNIIKEQYEYHTYMYCPEICLENMSEQITNLLENSVWIYQLKASKVYDITSISLLFSITHNRKNKKDGTLLIAGESDTGKSTMHKPFREAFPAQRVGYLKQLTEHHIYDQMLDKDVVIIDEGNSVLRHTETTAGRADGLLVLGGETAIANKKMGEIRPIATAKGSLTLTVNQEIRDEGVYNNETIMNRMQIILTSKTNELVDAYTAKAAKTEAPLIILFAGMCSLSELYKLDYVPNPIIYDELTEEEKDKIETYNEFDSDINQPSRHFDDEILRFSLRVKRGIETIKTTEFVPMREGIAMPQKSKKSKKDKIEDIKREIQYKKFDKVRNDKEMYRREGIEMNVHANMRVY